MRFSESRAIQHDLSMRGFQQHPLQQDCVSRMTLREIIAGEAFHPQHAVHWQSREEAAPQVDRVVHLRDVRHVVFANRSREDGRIGILMEFRFHPHTNPSGTVKRARGWQLAGVEFLMVSKETKVGFMRHWVSRETWLCIKAA